MSFPVRKRLRSHYPRLAPRRNGGALSSTARAEKRNIPLTTLSQVFRVLRPPIESERNSDKERGAVAVHLALLCSDFH